MVEAGVAITIAPRRCTTARLREAVEQLLSNPSYRDRSRALAARLANERGPERASELLERLVTRVPASLSVA
jgi:UDP:flavonoid glycosyltransferase YjiC (YdhE family)